MSDKTLSISKLQTFKACRRAYELKYNYGLEPIKKAEALEVGINYHKKIEKFLKDYTINKEDYSKEQAMFVAFLKYLYPKLEKIKDVEVPFEKQLQDGTTFNGIADAITENNVIIEHKTTGLNLEEFEYNLNWSEQKLAYMYAFGTNEIWYTVIKKPTIRQRKNESDIEFYERMVAWYNEDNKEKLKVIKIVANDEEINDFIKEFEDMTELISKNKNFYRNTQNCWKWGKRCEYSDVCLNYDPKLEYINYVRKEEKKENEI